MWLVSWKAPELGKHEYDDCFEFEIKKSFSKRFQNDKCLFKDNHGFFIQDGVLLNKRELIETPNSNILEYIVQAAQTDATFFSRFRGPFSGCIYNLEKDTLLAYGNQTGDAALFYYYDKNTFVVSSDFNEVFIWCKTNHIKLSLNEIAVNHLLSLGYVTEGNTIIKEIRKLNPGTYLSFSHGDLSIKTYHRFVFGEYSITKIDEAVELVDQYFRKAVKQCFDKDLEYGYLDHLVDISGGLDSRMTCWVARELGYENILNICYAQSGSNEEIFGKAVAEQLGNQFYFEALDDVEFIFDLEKIVWMNYGLAVYAGITGGERLLSHLDFNKYGLEQTGQLGDVIVGYKGNVLKPNGTINTDSIAYSTVIKPIFEKNSSCHTGEEFAFYYRFFHGTLATHYIRKHYTEAVSPFIDVDFAQLCFNISPELRENHKLYWEWIRRKYPKAYGIPSTRSRESKRMKIYHMLPSGLGRAIIKTCKMIGLTGLVSDKRSMNPFDLWYENNSRMREFINKYFEENIIRLSAYPNVKNQIQKVMNGDRVMDKLQVITILAACRKYLSGERGE